MEQVLGKTHGSLSTLTASGATASQSERGNKCSGNGPHCCSTIERNISLGILRFSSILNSNDQTLTERSLQAHIRNQRRKRLSSRWRGARCQQQDSRIHSPECFSAMFPHAATGCDAPVAGKDVFWKTERREPLDTVIPF
jgi:hypothetical protein